MESSLKDFFDKCCNELLLRSGIRFVGVVSNLGRQISGNYNKEITPLVDENQHKMCMEQALELSMSKDLDEPLGVMEHIISKKKNVTMITVPFDGHLFLISIEPDASTAFIIKQISQYVKEYFDMTKK
jgi:hypothetical protein